MTCLIDIEGKESEFIKVLRQMMQEEGLKQADIARAVGHSEQFISDVFRGLRYPLGVSDCTALHHAYGFDLTTLLTARAWTLKRIELPPHVTFAQVEEMVEGLLQKRG